MFHLFATNVMAHSIASKYNFEMKKNGSNLSSKLLEEESAPASNRITTSDYFSTTRGGPEKNSVAFLMRQGFEPRTKGHVYKNIVHFDEIISLLRVHNFQNKH